jgi:hypothetical protein
MSKALASAKRRRGSQSSLNTVEQKRRPGNKSQQSSGRSISNVLHTYSSRINSLEIGIPNAFAKCKKDMDNLFQNTTALSIELDNLRGTGIVTLDNKVENHEFNEIKQKQKELEDKQTEIIDKYIFIDNKINGLDDIHLDLNSKLGTINEQLHDYNNLMMSKLSLLEKRLADRYLYKSLDELRIKLETSDIKIDNLNKIINCKTPNQKVLSDYIHNDEEFNTNPTLNNVANNISKEVTNELILAKSSINEDEDDGMPTFPTINK